MWDKTLGIRPSLSRFRQQAEFLVWGSKGAMPVVEGVPALAGVFKMARDGNSKRHQTGKPVELMRQILSICRPGGTVLDPFNGGGATGVAALQSGRRYVGIELTDAWHTFSSQRLANAAKGLEDADSAPAE